MSNILFQEDDTPPPDQEDSQSPLRQNEVDRDAMDEGSLNDGSLNDGSQIDSPLDDVSLDNAEDASREKASKRKSKVDSSKSKLDSDSKVNAENLFDQPIDESGMGDDQADSDDSGADPLERQRAAAAAAVADDEDMTSQTEEFITGPPNPSPMHMSASPTATSQSELLPEAAQAPGEAGAEAAAEAEAEAEATAVKESKTQRNLGLIFDPAKSENEKSLWQFFLKRVSQLPTVDELAARRIQAAQARGLSSQVDMDRLKAEWYAHVLALYREYLQTAFEEPLELSALGKRISRYTLTHRTLMDDWHQQWIEKYKSEYTSTSTKTKTNQQPSSSSANPPVGTTFASSVDPTVQTGGQAGGGGGVVGSVVDDGGRTGVGVDLDAKRREAFEKRKKLLALKRGVAS